MLKPPFCALIFSCLTLAHFSARADSDQHYELLLKKKPGYEHDQSVRYICAQMNIELQNRVENYLKNQSPQMSPDQLSANMVYEIERNPQGRGTNLQYIHSCTLQIRLTDDAKKIIHSTSATRYTGSARLSACTKAKASLEQNPAVLFSEIHEGLFSCKIDPIIEIR